MRVLTAHVTYRHKGGEDVVFETEARLLSEAGHHVSRLNPRSVDFDDLGPFRKAGIALGTGDHSYGRELVAEAIRAARPDVVHFHNLYPQLGPGALMQAAEMGCGVVQTLHNYRMSCIAGTHVLNGSVCERCAPGSHLAGVVNRCYRHSALQSIAMAMAVSRQWAAREHAPHVALALTPFAADRLVAAGMSADRVIVKPNSVDEGQDGPFESREGVCCVGRLSPEKGVADLAGVWPHDGPTLRIAGDGPELDRVRRVAAVNHRVDYLGLLSKADVRRLIRESRVLAVPSKGFEGMPLTVLEGFAESTPVLMLEVGARAAMGGVELGGCRDVDQLASAAVALHESPAVWVSRSAAAHEHYLERHTHELNVRALESAYARALSVAAQARRPA